MGQYQHTKIMKPQHKGNAPKTIRGSNRSPNNNKPYPDRCRMCATTKGHIINYAKKQKQLANNILENIEEISTKNNKLKETIATLRRENESIFEELRQKEEKQIMLINK